ncbi:hypothetical protein RCL1_007655 [Eukaryota sp. TZLM3-RCL]
MGIWLAEDWNRISSDTIRKFFQSVPLGSSEGLYTAHSCVGEMFSQQWNTELPTGDIETQMRFTELEQAIFGEDSQSSIDSDLDDDFEF